MFKLSSILNRGLSVEDAIEGIGTGTVTVIDVRDHAEVRSTGKATGALHIPLARLQDMANPSHPDFHDGLRTERSIAVYCASGGRSMAGKQILRKLGYRDVHNIGGLGHWVKAGGKVEPV
ncbi:sulfurtransferase [Ruegeria sediminis]|uniref:Sulfurtransferase n=1 Tax=Ruegeria sediminis TaxID=2583820 RepID=A0ABY2X0W2_9RHOB|nr:rhodanese-like domain-containing protein [Ruegeria sediminis]TMV08835.1 sulfurtransferase [Ruegeria sediminis]